MTSPNGRPSARQRQARESFGSAAAAIGPVVPGMSVFLLTRGQFSMLDMVLHILNEVGPASVSVWTWAIADYEVEAMAALMASAAILRGRLIVDRSAEQRSASTIAEWRSRFGSEEVRVCKNHAKVARIWTADRRVLLRGSMNLNWNPRFEQADVSEGGPEFDLVERVEDELPVLRAGASNLEADAASGLGSAYEKSTLAMFHGVRPWSK